MSSLGIEPVQTIQKQVLSVQESVQALKIENTDDYKAAGVLSQTITALRRAVDATFDPIIAKAYATHRESCAQKKKFSQPLEADQKTVDQKILTYDREQEAIRRQEEEELRKVAQREQEEQALQEAEQLYAQGESTLAEIVLESATMAPPPVISLPCSTPKLEGLAKRVDWQFRITNPDLVPKNYCTPDLTKIRGVVRALKGATKILGVEVFPVDIAIHR